MIVGTCSLYSEVIKGVCEASSVPVVAATASSDHAMPLAHAWQPDVAFVYVDYMADGMELARQLKACRVNVVIMTGRLQAYTHLMARRLSVQGGLHRADFAADQVRQCLDNVAHGQSYFSATWERCRQAIPRQVLRAMNLLTDGDVACLRLIGRGYTDAEVGEEVGISLRTAQGRRSRIMKKLELHGTPKLMRFALEQGFADLGMGGCEVVPQDGRTSGILDAWSGCII